MLQNKLPLKALIIALLLMTGMVNAQTVYHLTLDSAIAIARSQSYSIKTLNEDLLQATYQLRSVKKSFLPSVDLNGYLPKYTEALAEDDNATGVTYYAKKASTIYGNMAINQQLPTDGTLSLVSYSSHYRDIHNQVKTINTSSLLEFSQPLQAFYAYNAIQTKLKNARLQFELASKRYKREELSLIYTISGSFYSLVSAVKQQDIAYQNLIRQQDADKTAKSKYGAGLIKEVEALQIEVDLGDAINQYDVQTTTRIQQANTLKQLLGLSLKDSIVAENKLEYKPVLVDVEKAVAMGLKNRTEIREDEIQISQSELSVKQQRAARMISGNVSAYYEFIGNNTYPIDYSNGDGFNHTFSDMLKTEPNRGVTLSLKIPILDWGSNRALVKLKQSQLKQNQMQLNNQIVSIENEIRNMVGTLQSTLRRLQLLEINVKLAEKSYTISYARFTNGDIDAEALSLDRSRYNNTQQYYLTAYINYKLGLLDLNRRTFYDFENNKSLVPGDN
jgi:outer membrane protein